MAVVCMHTQHRHTTMKCVIMHSLPRCRQLGNGFWLLVKRKKVCVDMEEEKEKGKMWGVRENVCVGGGAAKGRDLWVWDV